MSRATTKSDLVIAANEQFNKLWKLIGSMSEEQQSTTFGSEMATVGKEAHWSGAGIKTCAMCWYICTNGTNYC